MKKSIGFILFLLLNNFSFSQNWNVVQSWHKMYYATDDGTLYTAIIDSSKIVNTDSVFYPYFHYGIDGKLAIADSESYYSYVRYAPSWLGKVVRKTINNNYYFSMPNGNEALLQANAPINSSWRFYTLDDSIYYTATISKAVDTVINTMSDSVKIITIKHTNTSKTYAQSYLYDYQIILSKKHGIIVGFDIYHSMPFFFTDKNIKTNVSSLNDEVITFTYQPNTSALSTYDLYNYDKGTEKHLAYNSVVNPGSQNYYYYYVNTKLKVLDKIITGDTTYYTIEEQIESYKKRNDSVFDYNLSNNNYTQKLVEKSANVIEPFSTQDDDCSLVFKQKLTGRYGLPTITASRYATSNKYVCEESAYTESSLHLGHTYGDYPQFSGFPAHDEMVYYKNDSGEYGNKIVFLSTNTKRVLPIKLYPNPVLDVLNIYLEGHSVKNINATIYNLEGRQVQQHNFNTINSQTNLNLKDLSPGLYTIHIISGDKQANATIVKQ